MCKKYGVGGGKAAAQVILLTQPAKSELLLPLLLPLLTTLLLLKPLLLLLTSQMATGKGPGPQGAQGGPGRPRGPLDGALGPMAHRLWGPGPLEAAIAADLWRHSAPSAHGPLTHYHLTCAAICIVWEI